MRLRMFTDAVLRDSNTLSPSHTGQATRWAMASARSSGRARPVGAGGADGEEADDDEHEQHPSRPALQPRSSDLLPEQLQLVAEVLGGDPGDDAAADDPVGIDDPRLGHLGHAEGRRRSSRRRRRRPASRRPRRRRTPRRRPRSSSYTTVYELGAVGAERLLLRRRSARARGAPAGTARSSDWKKLSTTQSPLRRARSNVEPSANVADRFRRRPVEQRRVGRLVGRRVATRRARRTARRGRRRPPARRTARSRRAARAGARRLVRHRSSSGRSTDHRAPRPGRSGRRRRDPGRRPAACRRPSSRRRSTATGSAA